MMLCSSASWKKSASPRRSCLRFCKEKSSASRYAKMDSAISKAIAFRYLRWDQQDSKLESKESIKHF